MNFSSKNNLPLYFWVVSITSFIWNAFGVYSYLMEALSISGQLGELSSGRQNFDANLPAWYISAFAIAVFAGLAGSIGLLIRKRWAYIVFIISFLSTGIQQFYVLTEINPRDIFLSLSAIVIAVFLVWFSKRAAAREWLK
ncbi:MAG: hypothetical protein ABI295_06665 [Xanthomarina sp.]